MFQNYFKIALRNFRKQKLYSTIIILGFTLGMTCCLLIMLYVRHESSYDRYFPNAEKIYRIASLDKTSEGTFYDAASPVPLAPALKAEYSEFEHITRLYFEDDLLFELGDKRFLEDHVAFADPEFFKVFPFRILKGQPGHLLDSPDAVVLTASAAEKYFGHADPIGQSVRLDKKQNFRITGVIEDIPPNTHFHFDILVAFLSKNAKNFGTWIDLWTGITSLYTYAVLPENIDIEKFTRKVEDIITEHSESSAGAGWKVFFQPLRSIYLNSHLGDEIEQNNSVSNLAILTAIALLILVVACINYINLATSQSAKRAKEVGMRKVMGADARQLVGQFVGESILSILAALFFSLLLVEILLPSFASLVGKPIISNMSTNFFFIFGFILVALFVGVLSSLYPAIFLSRHQPSRALKGIKEISRTSPVQSIFKKGLVVAQFVVSILLVICTLMINKQLHYMRTARLGFDKEHMVVIPFYDEQSQKHGESIKQELLKQTDVLSATACFKPPIGENAMATLAFPKGKEAGISFTLFLNAVDYDFIDNFGIELAAGRNFSPDYSTDSKESMMLNEAAAREMGLASPEEAIGKKLKTGFYGFEGTIIGVTRDHHISSFREEIKPMAMIFYPDLFLTIAVKIRSQNIPRTLATIKKIWTRFVPEYPFVFSFLDANVDKLYRQDEQTAKIIQTFSVISIFIACLGLIGIAAHTAERRTKEIGIRKILGASATSLVVMLSSEFTKWVFLANVLAWPIGYYAMHRWLQNFAYRASLEFWIFLLAGALAFCIALLTVSYQAIKTAFSNPVKSLRYE